MDPSLYLHLLITERRMKERRFTWIMDNYFKRKRSVEKFMRLWTIWNKIFGKPPSINYKRRNFYLWVLRHKLYWWSFNMFTKFF